MHDPRELAVLLLCATMEPNSVPGRRLHGVSIHMAYRSLHIGGLALLLGLLGASASLAQNTGVTRTLSPGERRTLTAIRNGDMAALKAELDAGVDPNFKDTSGYPVLVWCISENQPSMVGELVRRGADLNYRTEKNNSFLHLCITNDKPQVLEAFLDAGMDVDSPGVMEQGGKKLDASPLTLAAMDGKMNFVQLLVRRNANLNHVDSKNGTPVFRAWENKHEEVARYLEGLGATDNATDARANPLRVGDKAPRVPTPGASGTTTSGAGSSTGSGSSGAGGAGSASGPRAPSGGLLGTDVLPPIPPRPARPIYEVNVGNVLGGPLSGLWAAFSANHSDWGLNSMGHKTNLGPGVTMTGGSRIDSLPSDWASEIYSIGTSQGHVPSNPEAAFLVAPRGGVAIVAAQEEQARQAEAQQATAERDAQRAQEREQAQREQAQPQPQPQGEAPSSQASGRPGS